MIPIRHSRKYPNVPKRSSHKCHEGYLKGANGHHLSANHRMSTRQRKVLTTDPIPGTDERHSPEVPSAHQSMAKLWRTKEFPENHTFNSSTTQTLIQFHHCSPNLQQPTGANGLESYPRKSGPRTTAIPREHCKHFPTHKRELL